VSAAPCIAPVLGVVDDYLAHDLTHLSGRIEPPAVRGTA
jgi:hypothetical protein